MRFFHYSTTATPEFKNEMATQASRHDMAEDGAAYTPPAAAVVLAILLVAQTIVTNTRSDDPDKVYQNAFNGSQIAVTALSVAIVLICKTAMQSTENRIRQLISDGVTNRFFDTVPTFPIGTSEVNARVEEPSANPAPAAAHPDNEFRVVISR